MSELFYKGLALELKSKFKRVNNFTKHRSSIGTYHEEALKTTLQQFLSKRFSIKTGFVYAGPNKVSQQVDILIIDENESSCYFLQEGNFVITHPDAVVCAIEVKSKLQNIFEPLKNLNSVGNLGEYKSSHMSNYIPTFLFAYSASKYNPPKLDILFKKCPEQTIYNPLCIFVLNNYFLQFILNKENPRKTGYYSIILPGKSKEQEYLLHLSVFLSTIKKACDMYAGKKSNPFNFSLISDYGGVKLGLDYFQFKNGLVKI